MIDFFSMSKTVTPRFLQWEQEDNYVVNERKSRSGGTQLGGQNMFLTSETCRNELFSNYHKFKKIREVMVIKFENIVFFCEIMTIEQDMGSNFLSEHLIIISKDLEELS